MLNLVIGADGFIGTKIYEHSLAKEIETYGTNRSGSNGFLKFDITTDSIQELCQTHHIKLNGLCVVVCAAVSKFNECYFYPEKSYEINVTGILKIVQEMERLGVYYILFSSEAIFDGVKGFYSENDFIRPILRYGKQKAEMELLVYNVLHNGMIIRISKAVDIIYRPGHILYDLYNQIMNSQLIQCIKDQCFTPVYVGDLAEMVIRCEQYNLTGIYHISNGEMITRKHLAETLCFKLGIRPIIIEKELSCFSFPEPRYIRGGLDNRKIMGIIPFRYKSNDQLVDDFIKNIGGYT